MKWLLFSVASLVIVLDLWTKQLVLDNMALNQTIPLPLDILQLTYVRNTGGAFGILQNQKLFFILSAVLAVACIIVFLPMIQEHGKRAVVYCGMILGGALGNLVDRIRFSYVVDFLDLKWWPVFNVADIGITVGITLLVLLLFRAAGNEDPSDNETSDQQEANPEIPVAIASPSTSEAVSNTDSSVPEQSASQAGATKLS